MLSIDCTFKKFCVSNLHSPRINFRLVFSLSAVYKVKRALSDWSRYYVAVSKSLIFEKGLTFGPLRVLHCVTREKEWKEGDGGWWCGGGSSDEQKGRRTPPKWSSETDTDITAQIDAGTQSILKTITWVRLKGEHHVLLFSNDHRLINLLSIIFKIELCFLSGPNLTTKLASSTIEERGKWIIMIFMLNGISLLLFETTLSMMKYPHPVFWKIETINSV